MVTLAFERFVSTFGSGSPAEKGFGFFGYYFWLLLLLLAVLLLATSTSSTSSTSSSFCVGAAEHHGAGGADRSQHQGACQRLVHAPVASWYKSGPEFTQKQVFSSKMSNPSPN